MQPLLALLLPALAAGQAIAAYWPEIRGRSDTITARSAALDTPVVPFGPFFAIWLLLFAACLGFAAHFALAGGDARVGWLAAALFAGNIWWERHVPARGLDRASVGIILLEAALGLALLALTQGSTADGWAWWLGVAPLQLLAGWITVAAFANLSSTLLAEGRDLTPGAPLASLLAAAAGLAAATLAWASGAWPFAAAAAWGLAGIAVSAATKGDRRTAALAIGGTILTLAAPLA